MSIFDTFQFLRPHFLWLLLLFLILPLLLKRSVSVKNVWEKVCDKVLLSFLTVGKETKRHKKFNFWIYLSFLCGIIALSGPSFKQTEQPVLLKETPLMIVLDLSTDMNRTEGSVSRLTRAKIEITDILKKSKAAPSGLIVYTYEPFLISPLAYDSNIITNLLPAVNTDIMPLNGNKLDRAIDFAVSKLRSNDYKEGNILVLTADMPLDFDQSLKVAREAAEQGYKISVYGLSSKTNEKLEQLAKAGEGMYLNAGYASSENLIRLLKNKNSEDYSENKNTISVPEDDGIYFVFAALLCILPLFYSSFGVLMMFLLMPIGANAGFLFNDNQEGAIFYSSKEYHKAAQKFKNEDWKAAAYYKAGNYDAALKILERKNDMISLYNKGNALAKSGKIQDAMATYEEVLKKEPNNEDARFNLEYLKRLQQQQQSKSENQKNEQNNDEQNNQNQNNNQNDNQNQNQNSAEENQQDSENENQSENQSNAEENEQDSENKNQSENGFAGEEENTPDEDSDENNDRENKLENDMNREQKEAPVLPAKQQEASEYDETVQAREQKFRAVKEDPGGLLRAFIKEEYLKKRYTD